MVTLLARALGGPVAPLIIAGRGVVSTGGASALRQLARRWGCPIAVTPDAKSAINSRSSYALGVCGVMGHPEVLEYAHRAPLCLLVGTPLPDVASFALAEALASTPIMNVGERLCFPGLAGHPEVIDVLGDVEATLTALLEQVPAPSATWGSPAACPIRVHRGGRAPASSERQALGSVVTMQRLAGALEPGSDVFVDAGNAGAFAVHHLPADGIGSFSVALGMGAMGHAFGAAIGAAVHSRRRTYVVAGDGAFFMHGLELHTALEYELPITYIVLNNNAHAMCTLREERLLHGDTGTHTFAPALLARGAGAMFPRLTAFEVATVEDLDAALASTAVRSGPVFISVTVPNDEQPPFWPLADNQQQRQKVRT